MLYISAENQLALEDHRVKARDFGLDAGTRVCCMDHILVKANLPLALVRGPENM